MEERNGPVRGDTAAQESAVLRYAIGLIAKETVLTVQDAQKIYDNICESIGIRSAVIEEEPEKGPDELPNSAQKS